MSLSLTRLVCLGGISAALLSGIPAARSDNAASSAKQPVTQAVLHLKFVKPSMLVDALVRPSDGDRFDRDEKSENSAATRPPLTLPGLVSLSPDDVSGDLTMRGDKAALDQVTEIVQLLDFRPRSVRLTVAIVRYLPDGGAAPPLRHVEATAFLLANNNALCETTVFADGHAFRIRLAPHVNGDNSVTVATEMSENVRDGKAPEARVHTEKRRRTSRSNDGETKTILALGLPDNAEIAEEILRTIRTGTAPAPLASPAGTYYLEVTPAIAPAPEK